MKKEEIIKILETGNHTAFINSMEHTNTFELHVNPIELEDILEGPPIKGGESNFSIGQRNIKLRFVPDENKAPSEYSMSAIEINDFPEYD